jgi:hypothetical protein
MHPEEQRTRGSSPRKPATKVVEADVVLRCRRRCCLCFFLDGVKERRRGQIAHLNRNRSDTRFDNLVFLCMDHHDEYDSRPSQSKGLIEAEVRQYRDQLYASLGNAASQSEIDEINGSSELREIAPTNEYEEIRLRFSNEVRRLTEPWRLPMWMVANQSEMFAYKAAADGICLIERIDLPDDRIAIACIQIAGNPGQSMTNCVEELCFQVCERLEIPSSKLVWLEHYDEYDDAEWDWVTFKSTPPASPFKSPKWEPMTPEMWADMRLKPKKRLPIKHGQYGSKLTKLFHWPDDPLI